MCRDLPCFQYDRLLDDHLEDVASKFDAAALAKSNVASIRSVD